MSALIVLTGRLGKNAEVVSGQNGKTFVKFSLASWDNRKKETAWYRCTFANRDQRFADMLTSGKMVQVHGSLEATLREANGKTYLNLDVFGQGLEFLEKKSEEDGPPAEARKPAPRPRQGNAPAEDPWGDGQGNQGDDDIPF